MIDKFGIDSHKLLYHVRRVDDWMHGRPVYPIYLEISPSGMCNHRCVFCAYDFVGYKPDFIRTLPLKKQLVEMGKLGVKSILYSGEGEPLLHKDISEIITHTKRCGIDAALATNGVLLRKGLVDSMLGSLTWIKISINAGTPQTYSLIHRTERRDFNRVLENVSYAVKLKDQRKYKCAIGMQLLLLPENYREIGRLVKISRDAGVDYLVVKPYSQHPLSLTRKYKDISYRKFMEESRKLEAGNDRRFSVIFRLETMKKWDEHKRPYGQCSAFSFWAHIDSRGDVWGCPMYLGKEKFKYGNIYTQSFKQIWNSSKRKKLLKWVETEMNINHCRINCRMDEINRFLWGLKHPPAHVNFI
jgi:GTP 3',8-cyclase